MFNRPRSGAWDANPWHQHQFCIKLKATFLRDPVVSLSLGSVGWSILSHRWFQAIKTINHLGLGSLSQIRWCEIKLYETTSDNMANLRYPLQKKNKHLDVCVDRALPGAHWDLSFAARLWPFGVNQQIGLEKLLFLTGMFRDLKTAPRVN
jgi:hypothetical protein